MTRNTFQTSGSSPTTHRCQVGILGFGAVGAAVARRLSGPDSFSTLQLSCICDRRAGEKRARQSDALNAVVWTSRFDDLLASDVDIIVESSPGEGAADSVRAALLAGKSVVTANRQVIAHQGHALLPLAERQGRQLRFGAAVGGAMPIVRAITDGLAGERIVRIEAMLNGTANAVLSAIEQGQTMDEAIAGACALGYADGDPAADLSGADAAASLAVLCALAFGLRISPDRIETRSAIGVGRAQVEAALARGGVVRQMARAEYDWDARRLVASVAPLVVERQSLFGRASGPENAAAITGAHAGRITLTGAGTGADALAVAVLSDVVAIARDRAAIVPAPLLAEPKTVLGLADASGVDNDFAEAV